MPPDRKGDVVAMVEEALRKDPDVSNDDLKRKAAEIDSDLEEVSARQFNARYPLQAKRKTSTDTGGDDKQEPRIPKTEPEASRREVIREGLIRFAHDVAWAEDKVELIDVLTSVDTHVDEVVEAFDLWGHLAPRTVAPTLAWYEYWCQDCGKSFEISERISEHETDVSPECPECGSRETEQLMSPYFPDTSDKTWVSLSALDGRRGGIRGRSLRQRSLCQSVPARGLVSRLGTR